MNSNYYNDREIDSIDRDLKASLFDILIPHERQIETLEDMIVAEKEVRNEKTLRDLWAKYNSARKAAVNAAANLSESIRALDVCSYGFGQVNRRKKIVSEQNMMEDGLHAVDVKANNIASVDEEQEVIQEVEIPKQNEVADESYLNGAANETPPPELQKQMEEVSSEEKEPASIEENMEVSAESAVETAAEKEEVKEVAPEVVEAAAEKEEVKEAAPEVVEVATEKEEVKEAASEVVETAAEKEEVKETAPEVVEAPAAEKEETEPVVMETTEVIPKDNEGTNDVPVMISNEAVSTENGLPEGLTIVEDVEPYVESTNTAESNAVATIADSSDSTGSDVSVSADSEETMVGGFIEPETGVGQNADPSQMEIAPATTDNNEKVNMDASGDALQDSTVTSVVPLAPLVPEISNAQGDNSLEETAISVNPEIGDAVVSTNNEIAPQLAEDSSTMSKEINNVGGAVITPVVQLQLDGDSSAMEPMSSTEVSAETNNPPEEDYSDRVVVFKDYTNDDRAILITQNQGLKLRSSKDTQEALLKAHSTSLEENVSEEEVQEMIQELTTKYQEGDLEAAEQLSEQISILSKKIKKAA